MQLFKLIVLTLLISSCSVQQKANRKIKWLKQHNYLSDKKDTIKIVVPEFKDTGSTKLIIEHDTIEKWHEQDSCFTKERVGKVIKAIKIKPINIDNDRIKLDIKVEGGEIKYDYNVKPKTIVREVEVKVLRDCPPQPWWDRWYIGVIGTLVSLGLLFWIFAKRE